MFHGGTTFGFMNGANIDRGQYHPQTTSYDYDAALDESGRPTPKYFAFRDAIAKHTGETLPPVPESPAPIAIPAFSLEESASLWTTLGKGVKTARPASMETFGQSYGYIVYRTMMTGPAKGTLVVGAPRDYVQVFLNGAIVGTLDRRVSSAADAQDRLAINVPAGPVRLDILVENTGRVNFNKPLLEERKGLAGPVTLDGRELATWEVFPLAMPSAPAPRFAAGSPDGPAYYRGSFVRGNGAAADTFLDLRGWGKGTVWINGHHLGRFWSIGPQQTLYVPGPWLRQGRNDVVVFDDEKPVRRTMSGLAKPVLDELNWSFPSGGGAPTSRR
jgi:beta-galactosidase